MPGGGGEHIIHGMDMELVEQLPFETAMALARWLQSDCGAVLLEYDVQGDAISLNLAIDPSHPEIVAARREGLVRRNRVTIGQVTERTHAIRSVLTRSRAHCDRVSEFVLAFSGARG